MTFKIATEKEFISAWFRYFKDPDGNDTPTMILGGKEDSYTKYVLRKQVELNTNNTNNTARNEKFTHKIEIKSVETESSDDQSDEDEDVTYYIWRGSGCEACEALDGEIFEEGSEPSSPHPNCTCTLEEVDEDGSKVKDGKTKNPEQWTEDSKSAKEILEERGVDYDKKVEGVRDKKQKEDIRGNGERWRDKWNNSHYGERYGQNKFSYYGKERMLPHYDKPQMHKGDDIALPKGTVIPSVKNGTVIANKFQESGYGNYVRIKNDDGTYSEYGHMAEKSPLEAGTKVKKGDIIGNVGKTGGSTGNHLHYTEKGGDFQHIEPAEESRQYLFDFYNELF
jgi:murein DD-endopeptidase MepM/ murein hydrolase activator NlpD